MSPLVLSDSITHFVLTSAMKVWDIRTDQFFCKGAPALCWEQQEQAYHRAAYSEGVILQVLKNLHFDMWIILLFFIFSSLC